jgi:hypothetical protein
MSTPDTTPTAPTQVTHPWRATIRTLVAVLVSLAASWGIVVQALGLDPTWQWVALGSAAAAGITRVMALPATETLLRRIAPWLAAGN